MHILQDVDKSLERLGLHINTLQHALGVMYGRAASDFVCAGYLHMNRITAESMKESMKKRRLQQQVYSRWGYDLQVEIVK